VVIQQNNNVVLAAAAREASPQTANLRVRQAQCVHPSERRPFSQIRGLRTRLASSSSQHHIIVLLNYHPTLMSPQAQADGGMESWMQSGALKGVADGRPHPQPRHDAIGPPTSS
jgi:hypothetical protein